MSTTMSTTRMLILGVLRQVSSSNGYAIRNQLELWNASQWANVKFGSIYHALQNLESDELIEIVESPGKGRNSTNYQITDKGSVEFLKLVREHWTVRTQMVDPLMAAITFMPSLDTDELQAIIERRRQQAIHLAETLELHSKSPDIYPRHIAELLLYSAMRARSEAQWCESALDKIASEDLP